MIIVVITNPESKNWINDQFSIPLIKSVVSEHYNETDSV